MHTSWRRFAVLGAAAIVLAAAYLVRAVGDRGSGPGPVVFSLLGAALFAAIAVLLLRQAVHRRRSTSGRERPPQGVGTDRN